MPEKRYKALILDMDGTLLNSKGMVGESILQLAAEYGIQLTPQQYQDAFGCASYTFMAQIGIADPVKASRRWKEIMSGMLDRNTLYDGVDQVLAAPIRRGLVTSQDRQELSANTVIFGLENTFEFTVTVEDTPFQKPHPRPLLHCLEHMGVQPEEALFVGDSIYDYGCAQDAGVDFGLATWGADGEDSFPNARFRFQSPPDMLASIETL